MQRAIDRSGRADFGLLSSAKLLPEETRAYVPAVLAAVSLLSGGSALTFGEAPRNNSLSVRVLYAAPLLQSSVPVGAYTGAVLLHE